MATTLPAPAASLDEIFRTARSEGRPFLLETEAMALLPLLGFRLPAWTLLGAGAHAEDIARAARSIPGRRVVAKIVAADVIHKSDGGGVLFVDNDPGSLREAHGVLLERFRAHDVRGVLVTELVEHDASPGSELLLGIRWTPDFGPTVTLAAGGVMTEFLARNLPAGREAAILSPSLDGSEIESILASKVITALVTGEARGQRQRMSLAALAALVRRALGFAADHLPDRILELEVNPFVPAMDGPVALDAVVRLGEPAPPVPAPRPIAKIDRLLHPASIAIAGASRNAANPGRIILSNLEESSFPRDAITLIRPAGDAIEGWASVPDVASLPRPVDLLVLAIPAPKIPEAIEQAVAAGRAEGILVIPGGLGEHAGSETLERRVRDAIASSRTAPGGGPVINGGNCLGLRSVPGRVDTIFLPRYKLAGEGVTPRELPLAFVSQSGALVVSKLTRLAPFAPRYVVSFGNQVDLTAADWLEHFSEGDDCEVLSFYVEGFRPGDGERWMRAAARATDAGKPVILYRAGRTEAGRKATASHTAVVAGEVAVARELARQAGVVVADSLEELEDLTLLFSLLRDRPLRGMRLAAVSNAGFETVAFADSLGPFELASFGGAARQRLGAIVAEARLESIVTIANPLDLNPMMGDAGFTAAIEALLADPGVDLLLAGCIPLTPALQTLPAGAHPEDLGRSDSVVSRLATLWSASSKPWAVIVDSGVLYEPMVAALRDAGMPVFRSADRALRALGRWAEWQRRDARRAAHE